MDVIREVTTHSFDFDDDEAEHVVHELTLYILVS